MRFPIAILAAAMLATAAQAETAAPPENRWSDSAEIVVKAPEPAMWKLTKGQSVVWVMGTLSIWPENFEWQQSRFLRLLKGSRQLIVPASEVPRMVSDPNLPGNQTLRDVLTPETYQRFASTVALEGLPLDAYERLRPAWAGFRMTSNFMYRHRISTAYFPSGIRQIAEQTHVPVIAITDSGLKAIDSHYSRMDPKDAEACLNDYLDNINYYQFEMPAVAEAWAHSDLKTVLQYYRDPSYITCLLTSQRAANSHNVESVNRMTNAIRGALKKPGKSVAIVIITDLLRKDGVLDQLRAEGVEVTAPTGDE